MIEHIFYSSQHMTELFAQEFGNGCCMRRNLDNFDPSLLPPNGGGCTVYQARHKPPARPEIQRKPENQAGSPNLGKNNAWSFSRKCAQNLETNRHMCKRNDPRMKWCKFGLYLAWLAVVTVRGKGSNQQKMRRAGSP